MVADAPSSRFILAMVLGVLLTGTLNTLTMKIQFTIHSTDMNGNDALFKKPWFGSLNMLVAMALVGLVDMIVRSVLRTRRRRAAFGEKPAEEPTNALVGHEPEISYRRKALYVAAPAFFDLAATALSCYGILYLPASVWQMLRGSLVFFVAIMSVCFLGKKMTGFNILGLALCLVGILLVGASNCLSCISQDTGHSIEDIIYGITMTMIGQVVQAAQIVGEEWLLKSVDLRPLEVVGWEGLWGTLMLMVFIFPALYLQAGSDHGSQENLYDTFIMIKNSPALFGCVLCYLFSCATFNATGIYITQILSGVHRMMLDASRTCVIWIFGLLVTAIHPGLAFGEIWTAYSPLQLIGFVFVCIGQATYGGLLHWPCITYPGYSRPARILSPQCGTSLIVVSPELRHGQEAA